MLENVPVDLPTPAAPTWENKIGHKERRDFEIRVELPGNAKRDLRVRATDLDDARKKVTRLLADEQAGNTIEWRGSVAFVK